MTDGTCPHDRADSPIRRRARAGGRQSGRRGSGAERRRASAHDGCGRRVRVPLQRGRPARRSRRRALVDPLPGRSQALGRRARAQRTERGDPGRDDHGRPRSFGHGQERADQAPDRADVPGLRRHRRQRPVGPEPDVAEAAGPAPQGRRAVPGRRAVGSMSVYDNVAFPLRQHTDMSEAQISKSSGSACDVG